MKITKIQLFFSEVKKHKNHRIPYENYESHENFRIPCENHENHENLKTQNENHQNHKILDHARITKIYNSMPE